MKYNEFGQRWKELVNGEYPWMQRLAQWGRGFAEKPEVQKVIRSKFTYLILVPSIALSIWGYNFYLDNRPMGTYSNIPFVGEKTPYSCHELGQKIDFSLARRSVCTLNIDGTSLPRIFAKPRDGVGFDWAISSPNGENIAFLCSEKFYSGICMAPLNGEGSVITLVKSSYYRFTWSFTRPGMAQAIWSPDSTKIATNCKPQVIARKVCIIDVMGKDDIIELFDWEHSLKEIPFWGASWSKDSKKIIGVCSENNGNDRICIINIEDESEPTYSHIELGNLEYLIDSPALSPDERQIVFRCDNDVCVIDVEGNGDIQNLSSAVGFETERSLYPTWSDDGKRILFTCGIEIFYVYPSYRHHQCVINSDGSGFGLNITKLFDTLGLDHRFHISPGNVRLFYDCRGLELYFEPCPNYGKPLGDPFELATAFVGPEEIDIDKLCTLTYAENFEVCQEPAR